MSDPDTNYQSPLVGLDRREAVCIRHPETNSEAWVHPDTLRHYEARGWERYEPPTVDDLEAQRPARNASTDEWRAYALLAGLTADEVESATRNELIDRLSDE
jgi:hypothetical protein